MKVLIVHPQMAVYGGAEIVVVRLAKYLQLQGHYVAIATLCADERAEYAGLNFLLSRKSVPYQLRGSSISALRQIWSMYRELKKLCNVYAEDFDVFNPHNFPAIWAVPKNARTVWMCNEIPDLWHNQQISKWLNPFLNIGRYADRELARSKHATAVVADDRMSRIFQHRYLYKPNIIPYGIENLGVDDSKSVLNGSINILCPAMISPSKNQLKVLEAVVELRKRNIESQVILSGYCEENHPYTLRLKDYVRQHNLNVTWMGMTTRIELSKIFATAHVAVFAGKGQGSWLGPFEQLLLGTPIIVSPNLTCAETVNEYGIITSNIADAVEDVYRNYDKYRQQALGGKEFVRTELTWKKFCGRFEELLWKTR